MKELKTHCTVDFCSFCRILSQYSLILKNNLVIVDPVWDKTNSSLVDSIFALVNYELVNIPNLSTTLNLCTLKFFFHWIWKLLGKYFNVKALLCILQVVTVHVLFSRILDKMNDLPTNRTPPGPTLPSFVLKPLSSSNFSNSLKSETVSPSPSQTTDATVVPSVIRNLFGSLSIGIITDTGSAGKRQKCNFFIFLNLIFLKIG